MKKKMLSVLGLGLGAGVVLGASNGVAGCGGVVLEAGPDGGAQGQDSGSQTGDSGSTLPDAATKPDAAPKDGGGKGGNDAACVVTRTPVSHRAAGEACPTTRGPGSTDLGGTPCTFSDAGPPNPCRVDSDCTAGVNGRCYVEEYAGLKCDPFCSYDECFSDSDCAATDAGNVPCACRVQEFGSAATPNACATGSECRVDSDCGPCGFCSPSDVAQSFCGTPPTWFCHTPSDECTDDSDCASGTKCTYDVPKKHWVCETVCLGPPP